MDTLATEKDLVNSSHHLQPALFFVTASILNVRVHVTSELFKAFLSQPIMVY